MSEVMKKNDTGAVEIDDGKKKSVGKSLSWLEDELLALSKSAAVVLLDKAVGS